MPKLAEYIVRNIENTKKGQEICLRQENADLWFRELHFQEQHCGDAATV